MSATTTQGTGNGSSEGVGNKVGNGRNQYVSLASPHILLTGVSTLSAGGAATIVFNEAIDEAPTNYTVHCADISAANKTVIPTKTGSTTFTGFTLAGGANASVINWFVVKNVGGYSTKNS